MEYVKGKTYEALEIGESASFSKTITETDICMFAGISGDFNPVHVDEAYAKTTKFKTRIAHDPLSQSLIAPVLGTKLPGLGTVALELFTRFLAPVYPGDTITVRIKIGVISRTYTWWYGDDLQTGTWVLVNWKTPYDPHIE